MPLHWKVVHPHQRHIMAEQAEGRPRVEGRDRLGGNGGKAQEIVTTGFYMPRCSS